MGKTKLARSLDHARAAFDRRAWREAFDALTAVDAEAPLERGDLERLVLSAALSGDDDAFLAALKRLHEACLGLADLGGAARAAFWTAFHLSSVGSAAAAGWRERARRVVEDAKQPCAEQGYLQLLTAYQQLDAAEYDAARELASEAARIGERFADRDLVALARNLEGRALMRLGRIAPGLALLDDVMIGVTSGELSPLVTGIVYCNVIAACQQIYALDRARDWIAALTRWCDDQPQLVTFTGICRVHCAEMMQLGGAWRDATQQLEQVCERRTGDPEVFGDACYQQGELHRLRGDLAAAEKAYRVASENGREPQPGLALLRLTQGQTEVAASAIRRVLATTTVNWQRARFLPACVEIMLGHAELDEARRACAELESIAREHRTEILGALAAHARGAVALAEGDHHGAIEPLRLAFAVWHRLGAPYIAARIRVLLGRAFLALGDVEGAELERAAARKVFDELGAVLDRGVLDAADHAVNGAAPQTHGLSQRELEVLRLLASGETNKAMARKLFVSERTIHRHVSNIFAKLGVGSRAAATAFAYEKHLV